MVAPDGIVEHVADILRGDAILMGMITGGVHTIPLKLNAARGSTPTPNSTPDAFDAHGFIKWSIVVTMLGTPRDLGVNHGYQAEVVVWLYLPQRSASANNFEMLYLLIYDLLEKKQVGGPNGTGAQLNVAAMFGPFVDQDFDAMTVRIPVGAVGVWKVEGVA